MNTLLLFLHQVDNFAITCPDERVTKVMIDTINKYILVQIKYLGLLTRYNGVNIDQTSD
jgi:hypothetical protein